MTKKEWQALKNAKNILRLGDQATLSEIKQAYYHLCRKYHPDSMSKDETAGEAADSNRMYALTEAYELLMNYCSQYRFPLVPPDNGKLDMYDPEDWWMARFGDTPYWGKKKK